YVGVLEVLGFALEGYGDGGHGSFPGRWGWGSSWQRTQMSHGSRGTSSSVSRNKAANACVAHVATCRDSGVPLPNDANHEKTPPVRKRGAFGGGCGERSYPLAANLPRSVLA